jgi:two-component system CheB/CheR fusion protein
VQRLNANRDGPNVRRRVLIVDDTAEGRDGLAAFISLSGHEVRTAADGREGLELAASFLPDIIFLDIAMPELDGYEVCSRLRARRNAAESAIYAVTGFGSEQHRLRSSTAGFDGHLVKPLDLELVSKLLLR